MRQIVLDDETRFKLHADETGAEIRDSAGNIVGYFVVPEMFWTYVDAWEKIKPGYIAELERRAASSDVGTLQDLWNELGFEYHPDADKELGVK